MSLRPALAGALLLALAALTSCAGGGVALTGEPVPQAQSSGVAAAQRDRDGSGAAAGPAPEARVGRPARSERVHFAPERIVLPGDARAAVEPAETVDGQLQVPENVRHVGWWDGSAYAGDPFGSTVIAGHVDSATEGMGYLARLLRVRIGDVVTVGAGAHEQRYRVTSIQTVAKRALASDSRAFAQDGPHRLVLITCAGAYRRDRGGYESNLVVIAKPLGLAR